MAATKKAEQITTFAQAVQASLAAKEQPEPTTDSNPE